MSYWDKKILREQLDKKLIPLRSYAQLGMSSISVIKSLREALGISTAQLGKKVGLDQSRISRLENSETSGNIKLSSLQKIARGLGMEFVYGFVPHVTLEEMVREQAKKIALERMKRLNHTMSLELQALSEEDKKSVLKDMIDKILIDNPKDLWNK
jgi:predicted DNA-binding mobile mystery protein A